MSRTLALAFLTTLVITTAAAAQSVERPPRVTTPPRTDGVTSSLQLNTSLFGGYNRNLLPINVLQATLPPTSVPPTNASPSNVPPTNATLMTLNPTSYAGWGSAGLRYSLDSGSRSLSIGGGGTANTNNNGPDSGPVYGSNASAGLRTGLGRGISLSLAQNASRTPYYTQGLFAGLPPGVYSPDGNPINGIVDGHLMSLSSIASLSYAVTRRTSTGVSYTYQRSLHEGGLTSVMSNKDHSAAVNVSQQITRSVSTQGSYRIAKRSGDQAGIQFSGYTHTINYGFGVAVPFTRTRTLAISAGGGATATENGLPERYWQPTYYASLATDIARTWVVSANYLQISAMLYSPLSAPDSYLTQSLVISAGGDLSRRLSLVLNTGASVGDLAAINSITGNAGRYSGVSAGVQLTTLLTDDLSAVGSVNYYRSELSGAANQLGLASGHFRRAAVRAGLTWDIPLLSTGRVPRAPRRR